MPKAKTSNQLTKKEMVLVACYVGNQVEACRLAGYKNAKKNASTICNRPRVKAAIEKKQAAMVQASGEKLGKAISITRNDIINRLDWLSEHAESDSTKVSALGELVDIFGLRAKDAKGDLFAGWTDEELDHYIATGELPARFGAQMGTVESGATTSGTPPSQTTRTERR